MNLPAEWADVERVQLEFDPSCEAMIFDTEGCPLQGITGGGGIDRRVEFILPKEKRASGYKCAFLSLARQKCASRPLLSRRQAHHFSPHPQITSRSRAMPCSATDSSKRMRRPT